MNDNEKQRLPKEEVLFADADDKAAARAIWKGKGYKSFGAYVRDLMEKDGVELKPLVRGGYRGGAAAEKD